MNEQVLPPSITHEDPKARAKADKAYAKAMRPWYKKKRFIIPLAIVVLIVLGQALNGGAKTDSAPSIDSDTKVSAAQSPAPESPAAVNEQKDPASEADAMPGLKQKVRDGQFEFTVTKVEKGVNRVGGSYANQKPQGQFVLINVTVSNVGDEAQLLADSSQKVRDAKGREFSADTTAAIYMQNNDVFLNEINPGNSVKGTLVFDMPKGTEPASIELHDSPFSDGVTVKLG